MQLSMTFFLQFRGETLLVAKPMEAPSSMQFSPVADGR
jgi:hypothetical protein